MSPLDVSAIRARLAAVDAFYAEHYGPETGWTVETMSLVLKVPRPRENSDSFELIQEILDSAAFDIKITHAPADLTALLDLVDQQAAVIDKVAALADVLDSALSRAVGICNTAAVAARLHAALDGDGTPGHPDAAEPHAGHTDGLSA